ncbi:hypothetical protein U9M48_026599 [Paspalum notatum var. saurae]|uniref:Uncharacterized protein n=1 Tax=Paspalum notatum var. saurae TaxID=547442 RepID=A0AAQ3TT41_PASNO
MDRALEENYGHRFIRAWPAAGYLLVAAPATAISAGLVQGPAMIFSAYAILLLGVAVIVRAMLPPRPAERVEERAVQNDGEENPAAFLAWCGYLLVAAPVAAGWLGLAGEPVPAFLAYVLLLLGVGFVGAGFLTPDKLKTI